MEVLEILGGNAVVGASFPLDTSHHFSNEDEIDDQRGSKKRVLADIEQPEFISVVQQ